MLEVLRNKTKAVRMQYAFFGALLVTVIIGGIWLLSLSVRLGGNPVNAETSNEHRGAFSRFFGTAKTEALNLINNLKTGANFREESDDITEEKSETPSATTTNDINTALNLKLSTTTIEEVRVGETILISTSSSKSDSTNSQ